MKIFYRKTNLVNSLQDTQTVLCIYFLDEKFQNRYTSIPKDKDLFKNLNEITFNNKYYVNEIVVENIKRKPYLDIETVYKTKSIFEINHSKIIKKLQSDIIKVFIQQYKIKIKTSDILILDSSGKVDNGYKLSLHIIVSPIDQTYYYTSSKYSESSAYHFYTSLVNLDTSYTDLIDPQVYKTEFNFRIIESHKNKTDDRVLIAIDHKTFQPIVLTPTQKLNYLLTYIDTSKPIHKLITPIVDQTTRPKHLFFKNKPTRTDCHKKLTDLVKKFHPSAVSTGISPDGRCYRYNYEKRQEPCPVTGKIHEGTNGFYVYEKSLGFYLRCHSEDCKTGSKYIGQIDEIDEFLKNAYQINSQFILKHDKIPSYLDKWYNHKKVLCFRSAMATGKTFTVEHIIKTYDFKKILWITHRQSLTKSLYGKFKTSGFVNYMDIEGSLYDYDRVIVQVDSLMRITQNDLFNNKLFFKKYDLVIIDEIEGCLNHFHSPFLNKYDCDARQLFDFMLNVINNSNKLLVLDADVNIRTKLFVENFDNAIVINNLYQPPPKTFTITNDQDLFEKNIFKDIKAKKKVCIVSMSSCALEKIAIKLEAFDINYTMHTSKTDDNLKQKLENVNEYWVSFQVVMYSPTVEAGIDFAVPHFDKIYSIIKDGFLTCSQRQHLQQIGRIRHITDNNILCWYDSKTEFKVESNIYTFDDALSYVRSCESLNGKRIIQSPGYDLVDQDDVVCMVKKQITISLFDKISLHNEVECLNKHPDIYLSVFNRLVFKAGNKIILNFSTTSKKKKKEGELSNKDALIEKLVDIDESKFNISDLRKRQLKNQLNDIEKLVLKKYFFCKIFKIKLPCSKSDMEHYLSDYLDKEVYLHRYSSLFGYTKFKNYDIDTFTDGKEKARVKIITDLVNRLTGKNYDQLDDDELEDVTISSVKYKQALQDIRTNSIYFKKFHDNRALFFQSKYNSKSSKVVKNIKHKTLSNTVISLLDSYNIHLRIKKQIRKGKTREYVYSLSVDELIKDIVIKDVVVKDIVVHDILLED